MIKTMLPYIQAKKKGIMATACATGFVVCVVLGAFLIFLMGKYEKVEPFVKRLKERWDEGVWKRD